MPLSRIPEDDEDGIEDLEVKASEEEKKILEQANNIDKYDINIPDNIDTEIETKEIEVAEIIRKKQDIDNKYNIISSKFNYSLEAEQSEYDDTSESGINSYEESDTELSPESGINTDEELEGELPKTEQITKEEIDLFELKYLKALDEFRNAKEILKEVTDLDAVINSIVTGKSETDRITNGELEIIMKEAEKEVEKEDLDTSKKQSLKNEIEAILSQFKKISDKTKIEKKLINKLLLHKVGNNVLVSNLLSRHDDYVTKTIDALNENIKNIANVLVEKYNEYQENNNKTIQNIQQYISEMNGKINILVEQYIENTYNKKNANGKNIKDLINNLNVAINNYNSTKTNENLNEINKAVANLKEARDEFVKNIYSELSFIYGATRTKKSLLILKSPNLPTEIARLLQDKEKNIDDALKKADNPLMRRLFKPVGFKLNAAGTYLNSMSLGTLITSKLSTVSISNPMDNKTAIILCFALIILILIAYYSYLVWFIFHRRGALELAKKIQFQCGSSVMEKYTVRYPSNFALEHEKDCTTFLIVSWILLGLLIVIIIGFWYYLSKNQVSISSGQRVVFIGIILVSLTTLVLITVFLNNSEKVSDAYNNSSENQQIKTQIKNLITGNTLTTGKQPTSYYQTSNQPLYFLPDKLEKRITGRILNDNNISDPTILGIDYYSSDKDNSATIADQIFPYLKLGLDSDDIELLYGSSNNQLANSSGQNIIDFKCRINLNYVESITQVNDKMGIIGYYEDKYRPIVWMTLLYSAIILLILFKLINSSYRPLLIGIFFIIYMVTFFIIYTS